MAVSPTAQQWPSVLGSTVQSTTNSSLDPMVEATDKWIDILIMLIAPGGLLGNSLVLWLLGFRSQRKPLSVYILNLAGADVIFLGSYFGLHLLGKFRDLKDSVWEQLNYYILQMSYSVGRSLLAAISTELCLSVLYPIWYQRHRPKHTSAVVCTIMWTLTNLFWAVFSLFCCHQGRHESCNFGNYLVVLWFISLIPVLCVSSLTLLLKVQCSSQRRKPPRLYLLVLLLVLVFLLFGVPLGIEYCILILGGSSFMIDWLSWLLACVNSSANPFIYFFLGSQKH